MVYKENLVCSQKYYLISGLKRWYNGKSAHRACTGIPVWSPVLHQVGPDASSEIPKLHWHGLGNPRSSLHWNSCKHFQIGWAHLGNPQYFTQKVITHNNNEHEYRSYTKATLKNLVYLFTLKTRLSISRNHSKHHFIYILYTPKLDIESFKVL